MYSRYTPDGLGGYDRQRIPDGEELRAAQGRSPPPVPQEAPLEPPPPLAAPPPETPPPGPVRGSPPGQGPRGRPMRLRRGPGLGSGHGPPAAPGPPGPAAPPIRSGLLGPGGLLSQLLPNGLDSEDLLILAVLLLSMKQDGAAPIELLIAAGLYLWLQ